MPEPPKTPAQLNMLFCPYCRDGFEGRRECPEHELLLVPIDRLPRSSGHSLETVTFFADPRLGRGPVLLGAIIVLGGFVAPFVEARGVIASALEVAIDGALNLWLVPGAGALISWTLWARRSRRELRAARLAVFALAGAGVLPLAYTAWRIGLMTRAAGSTLAWHWGLVAMLLGLALAALGSFRLGGAADAGS